jgi:hypothetical protein
MYRCLECGLENFHTERTTIAEMALIAEKLEEKGFEREFSEQPPKLKQL